MVLGFTASLLLFVVCGIDLGYAATRLCHVTRAGRFRYPRRLDLPLSPTPASVGLIQMLVDVGNGNCIFN